MWSVWVWMHSRRVLQVRFGLVLLIISVHTYTHTHKSFIFYFGIIRYVCSSVYHTSMHECREICWVYFQMSLSKDVGLIKITFWLMIKSSFPIERIIKKMTQQLKNFTAAKTLMASFSDNWVIEGCNVELAGLLYLCLKHLAKYFLSSIETFYVKRVANLQEFHFLLWPSFKLFAMEHTAVHIYKM